MINIIQVIVKNINKFDFRVFQREKLIKFINHQLIGYTFIILYIYQ